LTVAQRTPWNSVLEVAYVGSKSDYLSNYNNNFDQINDILVNQAIKAYGWLPNCDPTATSGGTNCQTPDSNHSNGYTTNQLNALRPYQAYASGSLKIIDHKMYSNYNGLQATWNKQEGHFIYMANYTFSKALGIRGESGSATGDPTNLRNNYGTLPNNRTHIFNVAYVYQVPNLPGSYNAIAKAAANGWQISGITQYQTGADIQAAITNNLGYIGWIPAGTSFMGKTTALPIQAGNQNTIGTGDVNLMPKLTCDPRKGLASHQYVNPNCFSPTVTPGQQGTYLFPTMNGPGFFNSDLSLFKNFVFGNSENRKLQFRFSGYNFVNHPVRSFQNNDNALSLHYNADGSRTDVGGIPFGYALYKTGHRIVQGEAKFTW